MKDEVKDTQKTQIEELIFKKLIDIFKQNYKPVSTSEGSILLTTQQITDKFRNILPEVSDHEIMKAMDKLNYKTTMLNKATGFDLYWMLKEK